MKRTALVLFALCGCVARSQATAVAARSAVAGRDEQATDDSVLAQTVRALSDVVASEGYQMSGPIERGFLAPGARALQPLTLPPDTCLSVVAVGTPSIGDLDTALYASDGTVLVEDDASDARPVVRFCSGTQPISAYLSLYAFQGTGTYALVRLTRPAGHDDARWSDAPESRASAAFLELVRTLRSRGYQDEGPGTELPLVAGAPLRIASKVTAGQCYSVIADGEQLRLRLLDEQGQELALGIGAEQPAALQYCAPRTSELTLELSALGGAQRAHLLRMHAAQTAVGGARAVWLGEPSAAASARSVPLAGAKVTGCSGPADALAQQLPLAQGGMLDLPLPRIASHRCEVIEARIHDGLQRATLRVESSASRVVEERELQGQPTALHVCELPLNARLVLVGRAGFGAVTVERRACEP